MASTWRKVTAGLAAAVALIAATAVPAQAETPAVTCRYTFIAWSGGFSADLALANSGPAIDGWVARWSFAIPTQATGVWSAQLIQASPTEMVATPAVWNKKIPTGGVVSFGWTATAITTEVPSDITVNGQRC